MEEPTKTKNIAPVWAIITIVIIAGILFAVFRGAPSANAPTTDDSIVDMQPGADTVATSTSTSTTPKPTTGQIVPAVTGQPQVIKGDGFTATIRPVTGETPVITSFTLKQKEAGGCIFAWEVEKATSCDVINTVDKTAVKGVPATGSLQTNDAGSYQLKCKAVGGKKAVSEVLMCK